MLPVVQTNEGQLSGWIVEHFTHQKNRVSEEFCKFKEKMLAWGIGFVENMACFGWGFMPQPGGTSAANIAMSGFSNFIQSEIQLVQIEIETAVLSAQLDAKDAWENAAQDPTGELMLEIPYTVGLCGSIGKS
jgi:hypothetical protein